MKEAACLLVFPIFVIVFKPKTVGYLLTKPVIDDRPGNLVEGFGSIDVPNDLTDVKFDGSVPPDRLNACC